MLLWQLAREATRERAQIDLVITGDSSTGNRVILLRFTIAQSIILLHSAEEENADTVEFV